MAACDPNPSLVLRPPIGFYHKSNPKQVLCAFPTFPTLSAFLNSDATGDCRLRIRLTGPQREGRALATAKNCNGRTRVLANNNEIRRHEMSPAAAGCVTI